MDEREIIDLLSSDEDDNTSPPVRVAPAAEGHNTNTNDDDNHGKDVEVVIVKTEYILASREESEQNENVGGLVARPTKKQRVDEDGRGSIVTARKSSEAQQSLGDQVHCLLQLVKRNLPAPLRTEQPDPPQQELMSRLATSAEDAARNAAPSPSVTNDECSATKEASKPLRLLQDPPPAQQQASLHLAASVDQAASTAASSLVNKDAKRPVVVSLKITRITVPQQKETEGEHEEHLGTNSDIVSKMPPDLLPIDNNPPAQRQASVSSPRSATTLMSMQSNQDANFSANAILKMETSIMARNDDVQEKDKDHTESASASVISSSNSDTMHTDAVLARNLSIEDEIPLTRPRRAVRAPNRFPHEVPYSVSSADSREDTEFVIYKNRCPASQDQLDNRVPMVVVDHLSKLSINPETNLPTKTFTCHRPSADMLFDFRIDVRESLIPNSGNGAFLTFLGARRLKDSCKRARPLNEEHVEFHEELQAQLPNDGYCMSIRLCGEVVQDAKFERPFGIGPHHEYEESDYEASDTAFFSSRGESQTFLVPLGRYGPFRNHDRKTKDVFDIKNFIFSHEPSGWSFGVNEMLFGRYEQMVDITDDVTGDTHRLARENLAMYVNEMGYDKSLTQNVQALEQHDRSVDYYININDIMKKGTQVELLVSYGDHYEEIRERKGYGLRNIKGEAKSDADPYWRYLRNVDVRKLVSTTVEGIDFVDVRSTMKFVEKIIRAPLTMLTNRFMTSIASESNSASTPSSLQWVAMARMHYMAHVFSQWLDAFSQRLHVLQSPFTEMLSECREWAAKLRWTQFHQFLEMKDSLVDASGINIRQAVETEIAEHIWYELRNELKEPFNKAIWCPIACDLVESLSHDVALFTWTDTPNFQELLDRIYTKAAASAEKVRNHGRIFNNGGDASFSLQFEAGVTTDSKLILSQAALQCTGRENSLNPKGLMTALNDLQVYADATTLATSHSLPPKFTLLVQRSDQPHFMVKFGNAKNESSLRSVPKSVAKSREQSVCVNTMWYVMWQVVFVANAFANQYIPKREDDFEMYSLAELCDRTRMDVEFAKRCIAKGIGECTLKGPEPPRVPRSISGRRASEGGRVPRAQHVWEGPPDEKLPKDLCPNGWPDGWVKRVYERMSGKSKGHHDRYWYTPLRGYKLRSMTEVRKYFICLESADGDEDLAWRRFKGRG